MSAEPEVTADEESAFQSLLKGQRALITIATLYNVSPPDSQMENQAGDALDRMIKDLAERPEKATEMLLSLLTLIVSMRLHDGPASEPFDEWFKPAGLAGNEAP